MEYESFEVLDSYLNEGKDERIAALEASLTAERKRADALAAALDGFVNYQAEGHFDEVLEHDEQLKSEDRAALDAYKQARGN